ncbi:MAG: type II toxin-antitoxin system HicA family toxin [Methylacidiphilales bacterium]|nr:type II toxin-antitoxin system HicA family toxin [Candidatus Methylacidiphilales bacterium]
MSRKYPVLKASEVIRTLRRNGFSLIGQSGSHQKWRHQNGRQVIVPMHGAKNIPIGTLKSIIDGSGLPVDVFR